MQLPLHSMEQNLFPSASSNTDTLSRITPFVLFFLCFPDYTSFSDFDLAYDYWIPQPQIFCNIRDLPIWDVIYNSAA